MGQMQVIASDLTVLWADAPRARDDVLDKWKMSRHQHKKCSSTAFSKVGGRKSEETLQNEIYSGRVPRVV